MSGTEQFVVVGLGEVLWDLLPTGAHVGGAPANFAYIAGVLGARSMLVSRVGDDDLGTSATALLETAGIDVRTVQVDATYPTGTTVVEVATDGTARYRIVENVAWDHLTWTPELAQVAAEADAVCFGTLAQRTAESRRTVHSLLEHTGPDCLRVLDVNLRPPFFDRDVLIESLQRASVVKLNEEEVPFALESSGACAQTDIEAAKVLRERWRLKAVCITRGPNGSVIATEEEVAVHPGQAVDVVDTVGAGDAFTAAMTLGLLKQAPLSRVIEAANTVACWVVSKSGAMPAMIPEERARLWGTFGSTDANANKLSARLLP